MLQTYIFIQDDCICDNFGNERIGTEIVGPPLESGDGEDNVHHELELGPVHRAVWSEILVPFAERQQVLKVNAARERAEKEVLSNETTNTSRLALPGCMYTYRYGMQGKSALLSAVR